MIKVILIPLLAAALLLSGCTTLHSIPLTPESDVTLMVRPGDRIRVHTKDARVVDLKVVAIEADAFVGNHVRINYVDIAALQVRRIDATRTAIVAVAGVAVTVGVVAAIAGHPHIGLVIVGA